MVGLRSGGTELGLMLVRWPATVIKAVAMMVVAREVLARSCSLRVGSG